MITSLCKHFCFLAVALLLLVLGHVEAAFAQQPLVKHLVYQYGGPETRTRCVSTRVVSDNFITGKVILCDGWATDVMQHAVYINWYAPNVKNASVQTKSIADDCLQVAIGMAIAGAVLSPPTVLTFFNSKLDTIKAGLITCVEANKALGRLFVKDFDLKVQQEDFW